MRPKYTPDHCTRRKAAARPSHDLMDLRFLDDERRRERYDVARLPRLLQNAVLEAVHQNLVGAFARLVRSRLQFDARDEAEIANIDHMRAIP